jgi:uncharacterized protein
VSERLVTTPVGTARLLVSPADPARATLVLGHGAGGGVDARDLAVLRRELPGRGMRVVAVEQPWRVAGRRVAPAPSRLDVAWLAVIEALAPPEPLIVAGRSAGARVACRTATRVGAVGVVALAFPLHPPGRPERSRLEELEGAGVPTLVVQGDRDAFGRPEEFPAGLPAHVSLYPVPGADHGFAVPVSAPVGQDATLRAVAERVGGWVEELLRRESSLPPGC